MTLSSARVPHSCLARCASAVGSGAGHGVLCGLFLQRNTTEMAEMYGVLRGIEVVDRSPEGGIPGAVLSVMKVGSEPCRGARSVPATKGVLSAESKEEEECTCCRRGWD